jgi:hypothetical protein
MRRSASMKWPISTKRSMVGELCQRPSSPICAGMRLCDDAGPAVQRRAAGQCRRQRNGGCSNPHGPFGTASWLRLLVDAAPATMRKMRQPGWASRQVRHRAVAYRVPCARGNGCRHGPMARQGSPRGTGMALMRHGGWPGWQPAWVPLTSSLTVSPDGGGKDVTARFPCSGLLTNSLERLRRRR